MTAPYTEHAAAVRVAGHGVLVRGASGSGKSSLVLGLIDAAAAAPAMLIADDRVGLGIEDGRLIATAPPPIAGKLEIRGQGIVDMPHVSPAEISLVVDLLPPADCPRLPSAEETVTTVLGVRLPRLMLPIGSADGPVRVRARVRRLRTAAAA